MARLSDLIEDIAVEIGIPGSTTTKLCGLYNPPYGISTPLGMCASPAWGNQETWDRLVGLVDGISDSPEQSLLTTEELRRFHSFRISLHRTASMEKDQLLRHLNQEWRTAKNGIRKLSVGQAIEHYVNVLLDDPASDRHHYRREAPVL